VSSTGPRRRPAKVLPATPRLAARAQAQRGERKRRLARRVGRAVAVVGALVAVAWVLLGSSWLGVDRVEVIGDERVTPEQVRAAAGIEPGTPLARIDLDDVEAAVRELLPVGQVVARRSWPGTVRLELQERTAVAGVVRPEGVLLVDRDGVGFATEPALPAGLVRLEVPSVGPEDATTAAALEVWGGLPAPLLGQVVSVRAGSPSSVELLLPDGRSVVWGAPGDTASKAAAASVLLTMPGRVVDVSAPGVAVRR
jgi:cell division protein FtsQ